MSQETLETPLDLVPETPAEPVENVPDTPVIEAPAAPVEAPVELPEQRYEYQPTDEQGRPIGGRQVIKYRTQDELLTKLQEQNVHLLRKLREETRKNRLGILEDEEIPAEAPRLREPTTFSPKELTPDERFALSRDLLDPEKFEEATDALFEAKLGVKPGDLRSTLKAQQEEVARLRDTAEVAAFTAAHPEYVKCPENAKAIANWLGRYKLSPVRQNLEEAYTRLRAAGVLVEANSEAAPAPVAAVVEPIAEPVAPAEPAPVASAPAAPAFTPAIPMGLTRNDGSDVTVQPVPGDDIVYELVRGGQKVTLRGRAALDAMPGDEYGRRLKHERGFAKKVDALEKELERRR